MVESEKRLANVEKDVQELKQKTLSKVKYMNHPLLKKDTLIKRK